MQSVCYVVLQPLFEECMLYVTCYDTNIFVEGMLCIMLHALQPLLVFIIEVSLIAFLYCHFGVFFGIFC